MKLTIFIGICVLLISGGNCSGDNSTLPSKKHVKRSYVCPPKFIRQGHRCYYFSKEVAKFQEAFFQCKNMRSNLAVIKTANQDKIIRSFLGRKTLVPLERWIGGIYDWNNKAWKWASSGKPLTYKGFANATKNNEENLQWYCTIMDPKLNYQWSWRNCLKDKHFICHTKMKTVTAKAKKKLQKHYNNKLNEVPVPEIIDYNNNNKGANELKSIPYELNDQASFAMGPKVHKKRVKKNRNNSRGNKKKKLGNYTSMRDIKWRTYREKNRNNPFYPRPIVEEFNFLKD